MKSMIPGRFLLLSCTLAPCLMFAQHSDGNSALLAGGADLSKMGVEPTLSSATAAAVAPLAEGEEVMPAPMCFRNTPLEVVARILAARLGQAVAIETNSGLPVTGDYNHMDLRAALADAARQAGLVVIEDRAGGVRLILAEGAPSSPSGRVVVESASAVPTGRSAADREKERQAAIRAAAAKRIELLKKRQQLLEQAP